MPAERNRRLLFISGIGAAQRGAQLLSTLITLPLVLHTLGVAGFGLWGAATSMAWLSGIFDLGLGSALLTLVPEALASGRAENLHRYTGAALLASCGMMLLLLAGGTCVLQLSLLHLAAPLLIACIALALNIPMNISRDLWFGMHEGHIAGFWDFAQTLLTLGALVSGASAGAGIAVMTGLVYAAMLAANGASLAHVLLRHPALRPRWGSLGAGLGIVLRRGSMLFAITIAGTGSFALDAVLTLHWLGPVAAAQMVVMLRICTTATGFLNIVSQPLWPAFVEAITLHQQAWLRRSLRNFTLLLTALAIAGSACIIAVGTPVLRLWLHQDMHFGPALLWTMAGWIVILTLSRIPGLMLNAAAIFRPQLAILAVVTLAGLVLKYFAARSFGTAGILAATPALWLFTVAPAYFWLAWRCVGRRAGRCGATA